MQEYIIIIEDTNFDRGEFQKELSELSGFPPSNFEGIFGSGTKRFDWKNSMDDMREISKIFNTRVITLQYVGDKISETYREYYLCGMVQVVPVRMSFDEFNPKYLS